ncbi:MAG: hypothetical protein QXU04_02815 [Archaeoglobaceae archaeon]
MAIEIGGGDLHYSFSDCVLIKKPYDGIDRGDSQKKRAVLLRIEKRFRDEEAILAVRSRCSDVGLQRLW